MKVLTSVKLRLYTGIINPQIPNRITLLLYGTASKAATSLTTGTTKVLATKIAASIAIVTILVTGSYFLLNQDNQQTSSNNGTNQTSVTPGPQNQTTSTKPKKFNPSLKASIKIPKSIIAGSKFFPKWTGPNNDNDQLVLFDKKTPQTQLDSISVRLGHRKYLIAPKSEGDYEVVYKTRGGKILARTTLNVIPSKVN